MGGRTVIHADFSPLSSEHTHKKDLCDKRVELSKKKTPQLHKVALICEREHPFQNKTPGVKAGHCLLQSHLKLAAVSGEPEPAGGHD